MGALPSTLYSQLPSRPRFASHNPSPHATAMPTSPNTPLTTTTIPTAERTIMEKPVHVPSVSPLIHEAESEVIKNLTSSTFKYEKRMIPITLPLSSSSSFQLTTTIYVNVLSAGNRNSPHIFLLGGFGAGVAFYSRNFEGLSKHFRIHLIDWPGMGSSSRPPYDKNWNVEQSESYFLDILEELIINKFEKYESTYKFSKLNLIGHSLGGYLLTKFSLRENIRNKINSLILISPIGLPKKPKSKIKESMKWYKKLLFKIIFTFWDLGYTPQILLRNLPRRLSVYLCKLIISSRFHVENNLRAIQALIYYFYQISIAPCSAELSLSTILESGAYARIPLSNYLHLLNVNKLVFLFGDHDWIHDDPAVEACEKIHSINPDIHTNILTVPNSGHHLYFENYQFFNQVVTDTCSEA